jgi:predicted HicB family RNase H-like nuclease
MITVSNETTPFTVRFDKELRRKLEIAAKSSDRTLNREVTHRLKRSFERQPDDEVRAPT